MLEILEQTYKGKKVFITGHTGFKGAWLLKILNLLGADIKGYALVPYTADDIYHLIEGDRLCFSVIADIRDRQRLIDEMTVFEPDFVFHLAAQPLVRVSYEIPAETFEVNAIGTANVLDAVRQLEKKCQIVLITTDKVYHNNEWLYPYRENDRLGGYDPYSASKACAELLIDSYRNSFFNIASYSIHQKAIAVGRAGNVIGGGDWAKDRLIPDIARALGNNTSFVMRNPAAVRPWQHVLEPLAGYLLLGVNLEKNPVLFSQAYNFGPNSADTLTVKQMACIAIDEWGGGTFEILTTVNQPHEAGVLKLDISKAGAEIGWTPQLNAIEALSMTISWYKAFFLAKDTIDELTTWQITSFLTKMRIHE